MISWMEQKEENKIKVEKFNYVKMKGWTEQENKEEDYRESNEIKIDAKNVSQTPISTYHQFLSFFLSFYFPILF